MMDANIFRIEGSVTACRRHGSGHINETYLVSTDAQRSYILQKINRAVFRDVDALMRNIALVTDYLSGQESGPPCVAALIPTRAGANWYEAEDGSAWRMYACVEGGVCLDAARGPDDFRQSGRAFGAFQRKLAAFDASQLTETIPRFHDTPERLRVLFAAAKQDALGRAKEVRREIDFAAARAQEASAMVRMLERGELPLRVTHNDTKLNNVLLEAVTGEPLCVVDLDTVMPGLAGNDFGDSIRFGASTAAEDERDLERVEMSLLLYEAYAEGFLGECGQSLTEEEIETLPLGAKLMTLECGVRFLTDYLSGDTYFHTTRPGQNLDRCRTQLRLVEDMEKKWAQMARLTQKVARR